MVAKGLTTEERFVSPPAPLLAGRWRLVRFTRDDAEELVRIGIIPEDATTELLDGMIVLKDRSARDEDPTRIGRNHRNCVERLSNLRIQINSALRHVESQQPLVCSDTHVPEPDFMIVSGTLEAHSDLPTAADAFVVIEVADSSYERDTGEKLAGYARAEIVQYIVLNLRNRTAEVYTHPDSVAGTYAPPQIVPADGTISLWVGDGEAFALRLSEILR